MRPRQLLFTGLLLAAFIVQGCSPTTPQATQPSTGALPTTAPAPDTPAPTATEAAPTVATGDIPVGFTEEGLPYRGNPNAPVILEEYSDFQ
jgi:hypothetical protein